MKLEYLVISGHRGHDHVMLMSRSFETIEAKTPEAALRAIAPEGWRFFADLEHLADSNDHYLILTSRPDRPSAATSADNLDWESLRI
jgi:hypothetical protein